MVTGALYHTDVGIVLALLSNKPDKPHGVPKDIIGRTAKLGYVFYKKTIGTKSRIDLYLLEDGRDALEDLFKHKALKMTREVPIISSRNFEGYKLTEAGLEEKFQETIVNPKDRRSAEMFVRLFDLSEYRENHIPDVHNVLWSAAGQLELEPTNHVTPIEIPIKALIQLKRAITYDVLCYYDHKLKQREEKAAEKAREKAEEEAEKEREAAERASSFDFIDEVIAEAKKREEQEKEEQEET